MALRLPLSGMAAMLGVIGTASTMSRCTSSFISVVAGCGNAPSVVASLKPSMAETNTAAVLARQKQGVDLALTTLKDIALCVEQVLPSIATHGRSAAPEAVLSG